jgi:sugar O-acyltransferase (sialic acid O-acetyltransferase NeuD family)
VIVGDSAFAEVAHEYFAFDSGYEVVGFSVERDYLKRARFRDLPVVPFEELEQQCAPSEHSFFVATVYTQGNRLRARLYEHAKAKGFAAASYVSSRAFVWRNCDIGEHCFIFEGNVIQPFCRIGANVVLWSGNHIGHHSRIDDHCFVASHAVVSGFCEIGAYGFVGVNATVSNNVRIGARCTIGAGALVLGDVPDDATVVGLWRRERGLEARDARDRTT